MKDVIVIGIAGGTGSGKSTLIQKIKDEFSNEITMLSHDFYCSFSRIKPPAMPVESRALASSKKPPVLQ